MKRTALNCLILISITMTMATASSASDEERWFVIEGVSCSPEPWTSSITVHIPVEAPRNSWIAVGRFVEYRASCTGKGEMSWRWTISSVGESEVKVGFPSRTVSSFAVTLDFDPCRPEPPSVVASRDPHDISTMGGWFPWPYLPNHVLEEFEGNVTEQVSTPIGDIDCYKLSIGQISDARVGLLNKFVHEEMNGFVWYDVDTGILVKEDVETETEKLVSTMSEMGSTAETTTMETTTTEETTTPSAYPDEERPETSEAMTVRTTSPATTTSPRKTTTAIETSEPAVSTPTTTSETTVFPPGVFPPSEDASRLMAISLIVLIVVLAIAFIVARRRRGKPRATPVATPSAPPV